MTGVYKIIDIINNKIYVGGAVDINCRWLGHRNAFNKGTNNIGLQKVYDLHGLNAFVFEILEKCNERELRRREGYYIKLLDARNPDKGYNIANSTGQYSLNFGNGPEAIKNKLQYITVKDIMKLYQCSKSTVYNWIDEGLPVHKFGRMTRFIEIEVDEWLKGK